jgi:hypothetical protein
MVKSKTTFEHSRMLSLSVKIKKFANLIEKSVLFFFRSATGRGEFVCLLVFLFELLPFVSVMLFRLIFCFHIYELREICF